LYYGQKKVQCIFSENPDNSGIFLIMIKNAGVWDQKNIAGRSAALTVYSDCYAGDFQAE